MEIKKYWVVVSYKDELQFQLKDDGTLELGEGYSPEKCRAAFEERFPSPNYNQADAN